MDDLFGRANPGPTGPGTENGLQCRPAATVDDLVRTIADHARRAGVLGLPRQRYADDGDEAAALAAYEIGRAERSARATIALG